VVTPLVGKFPVEIVPVRFDEFKFEIPEPFPLMRLVTIEFKFEIPETFREFRIPKLVMFGWDATVTLWAVPTVLTLAPFMFEIAEPFPEIKFELKIPETVRLVKVPTDVILGWAGWTTELAVATVPVIELG
jgi:hypothetical protein